MDETNVEQNLQYIKEMIEKTKNHSASQWQIFLLWGFTLIFAIIGMQTLIFFELFDYIWINWTLLMGAAGAIHRICFKKLKKNNSVTTYTQNSIKTLSIAMGIGYIIVGFIFPLQKVYSYNVIPIMISLLTGLFVFTIGGILEWNYLKWNGVFWFITAIIMVKTPWQFRTSFLIPLILFSYIIPALKLKNNYRND